MATKREQTVTGQTIPVDDRLPTPVDAEILTVNDVARWLRCSKKFVYALVERREIQHYKISNQLRFSRSELTKWLQKHGVAILEGDRAVV
ncbi:MAG: helix-turn-helix domain-containing protein [Proteobacteria bacterium]|jgi:excisionase family DNA binding protein|nr:helix-turn-helix domain-containing protein [Pseudomonadota bacterium]